MPKFFCDYCDVYLTHDSMSVRKAHNSGRNHLRNVVDYYQQIGHEKAQSVIDSITDSYAAEGQSSSNPMLPQNAPGGMAGAPGFPPTSFPPPGMPPFLPSMPPMPMGRGMPAFPPPGFPPGPNGMPPFLPNMPPPGSAGSPPANLPFAPPAGFPPNMPAFGANGGPSPGPPRPQMSPPAGMRGGMPGPPTPGFGPPGRQ